jgi:chromosome segregation ATPase
MPDVNPIIAVLTALGSIAGGVKALAELRKSREKKRFERLYKDSAPTETAPTSLTTPQLSLELKLQAKEIELLRAQYQIDQMRDDFRRLRASLDEAAKDQARLAARLTEQELLNLQLVEEMRTLRTEGPPDDAYDRRDLAGRLGRAHGRGDAAPRPVRPAHRKEGR